MWDSFISGKETDPIRMFLPMGGFSRTAKVGGSGNFCACNAVNAAPASDFVRT